MRDLLFNLNIILAQSPKERKLTYLYLGLFVFLVLLLVIDSREGKKLVGGNKLLAKLFAVILVMVIIVLVVLYFVL